MGCVKNNERIDKRVFYKEKADLKYMNKLIEKRKFINRMAV